LAIGFWQGRAVADEPTGSDPFAAIVDRRKLLGMRPVPRSDAAG
jgi:hypothetical protein